MGIPEGEILGRDLKSRYGMATVPGLNLYIGNKDIGKRCIFEMALRNSAMATI